MRTRILSLLGGILLIIYVVYQVFSANYVPIKTVSADDVSEYDIAETDGLAIRDEQLIKDTSADGYLYDAVQNGGHVAKDGVIAQIFPNEDAASVKNQLANLDAEIAALQAIGVPGDDSHADLDTLQNQIAGKSAEAAYLSMGKLDTVQAVKNNLLTLLNQQQLTVGTVTDFNARIKTLQDKRDQLASGVSQSTGSVTSAAAGYFSDTVDGYEALLHTKDAAALTADQIAAYIKNQPTAPSGYIGKVSTDFDWYIDCSISKNQAANLQVGNTMEILLPFITNDVLPVTVAALNPDSKGNTAVSFRCSIMSGALAGIRVVKMQIRLKKYEGLKVPDSALQFTDQTGQTEPGVFVQVGNVVRLKKINVLYHNDAGKYSICKTIDAMIATDASNGKTSIMSTYSDYLKEFDDIVISGKNLYDNKVIA